MHSALRPIHGTSHRGHWFMTSAKEVKFLFPSFFLGKMFLYFSKCSPCERFSNIINIRTFCTLIPRVWKIMSNMQNPLRTRIGISGIIFQFVNSTKNICQQCLFFFSSFSLYFFSFLFIYVLFGKIVQIVKKNS